MDLFIRLIGIVFIISGLPFFVLLATVLGVLATMGTIPQPVEKLSLA